MKVYCKNCSNLVLIYNRATDEKYEMCQIIKNVIKENFREKVKTTDVEYEFPYKKNRDNNCQDYKETLWVRMLRKIGFIKD